MIRQGRGKSNCLATMIFLQPKAFVKWESSILATERVCRIPTGGLRMLADHITVALQVARGRTMLDEIGRTIWGGMAQGMLSEEEAQRFADQLETLRRGEGISLPARESERKLPRHSIFPPRRKQTAPDRRSSLARRRRLASSGPVPPSLAAHFTTGELAVLRIIGDEWRGKGTCVRTLSEIAARAGVSRTTTQNAIRQARAIGMLKVEERPVRGAKNLPNKITVVSDEWKNWLRRGPKSDRVQKSRPHGYISPTKEEPSSSNGVYPTYEHSHISGNVGERDIIRDKRFRPITV